MLPGLELPDYDVEIYTSATLRASYRLIMEPPCPVRNFCTGVDLLMPHGPARNSNARRLEVWKKACGRTIRMARVSKKHILLSVRID